MDKGTLRWVGASAVVFVVLQLAAVAALFSGGTPPNGSDTGLDVIYVGGHAGAFEVFAFANALAYIFFIVFAVGLRDALTSSEDRMRLAASLFYAAALVAAAVALVGGGLTATGAVDAAEKAEPASLRAMFEAGGVMLGPVVEFPVALMLGAGATAIGGTGLLPRWTTWVGWSAAGLNLAATPSLFGGSNPTHFYSATGIAQLAMGLLPLLIWTLVTGVSILRRRDQSSRG